jgi:LuxR family maltose regulon positive regulatory protein
MSLSFPFPHVDTKLHVPTTRPGLVARPRLNRRLDRCLQHKLLLICAPAGFGKTTLLSQWSQQSARPVAWVSLDTTDNDPMHFWSYVVAALDKLEEAVGENVLPLIHTPRPEPVGYLIPALINSMVMIPDDFVLVLDDYYCIESDAIHEALAYLLDYAPPNMHVILATRTEPPLPLAQWRAGGHLVELRASDLRFSAEETERLFDQMAGLSLAAKDVVALQDRTEGWVAGLQLAALATRERSGHLEIGSVRDFRGNHQYVTDYLAAEVLLRQPESVRAFLLQTAILDTLEGSLCNALTGRADGRDALEWLHRQNLFISALNRRGQYRYHPLFADFLRAQLHRDPSFDLPALHLRAADWYERHGDLDRAIDHTLAAGRTAEAVELIDGTARQHVLRGEFATLLRWFQVLPDEVIYSRHKFCLIYAWVLANCGQMDGASRCLDHLETSPDGRAADGGAESSALLGEAATVRARMAVIQGDTAQNIHFSKKALALLPADAPLRSDVLLDLAFAHSSTQDFEAAEAAFADAIGLSRAVGNLRAALMATYYLADIQMGRGQFRQAVQRCQQGLSWCERADPPSASACWAHAGLGTLLYEWNDLAVAVDHLWKAVELAQKSGEVKVLMYARMPLAAALQNQGRADDALAVLDAAAEVARQMGLEDLGNRVAEARVRVWLAEGDVDAAATWLHRRGLSVHDGALSSPEIAMLARYHLAESRATGAPARDDLARVVELLDARYEADAATGWTYGVVQHLALLALAHRALGDDEQAVEKTAAALSLAGPMGLVRTFVDHGPGMAGLLRDVAAREQGSTYVARLLGAFRDDSPRGRASSPPAVPASQPLIEPLRQREIEVLRHIASGRSNREIADEMVLAESTVKWYLRNIYEKLNVHRRTQALARARELDLV